MAAERKLSQRDETLVKILDRLSDDIGRYELLLDEIKKEQQTLSLEIERTVARQHGRLDVTDKTIEKSHETINRYRSDMLSLVNEQDRLNEMMKDMSKKQSTIAFLQDNLVANLTDLSKRLEIQEKTVREMSEHAIKHEEELTRLLGDMSRSHNRIHMDSEKRMGEVERATQKRLDDMRRETSHRLLALDKIESSLNVLLIRTDPSQRKPFIVVRLFRKLRMSIEKRKLRRSKPPEEQTQEQPTEPTTEPPKEPPAEPDTAPTQEPPVEQADAPTDAPTDEQVES